LVRVRFRARSCLCFGERVGGLWGRSESTSGTGPASGSASGNNAAAYAEDEEPRIIGYAGLLAGVGEAEVLTIAVAPGHESRGLGAVLLTELMCEAARRECDDVVLEVRVDNDRAQRLYRRFGFEGVGVRKGYYQPMNIDALVMRSGDVMERFGDKDGDGAGDREAGAQGADRNRARGTGMDSVNSVDWVRE
jgi:ribosomal-protein-alanine acetyltransferase